MNVHPCAIEECERPVLARGWCQKHYNRWRKSGDPNETLKSLNQLSRTPCPVITFDEQCGRPCHVAGLCKMHYERVRRTGSVENRHRKRGPWVAVFWSLVKNESDDGCWLWQGRLDPHGYGRFDHAGKPQLAHRMAYLLVNGWLPEVLDHSCHNHSGCLGMPSCQHRRCCNPSHLVPSTIAENVAASHLTPTRNPVTGQLRSVRT